MSGVWLPPGMQTFFDPRTGGPAVGGMVYHWIPGTDTPKDTWEDEAQTSLNTNPILLDLNGQCLIWGDGLYRQVFLCSDGFQVWDQVTGFAASGGGGGAPVASPAETLAGLVNDKYVSPYALANSGVLTIPYASAAQVAAGFINDRGITPLALNTSGVIPIKANAAEVAALLNDTKFITPKALGDSGVLGGGGSSAIVSISQFGWIGDGVTDNAGFMAAMLASTSSDMYVPTGTYYVSGSGPTQRARLIKKFWGPGRFIFDDSYCVPGRYSYIAATPTLWPTQGVTGWFRGDTMAIEAEWHVIGVNTRVSTTGRYFEAPFIPHNIWHEVNSGASGMLSRAIVALAPGVGSAQLVSVAGINVGDVLAVTPWGQDGVVTDTVTVDSVNPGPNTITFHPNLTTNYPAVPPNGSAPGYATFFAGKRTWAGLYYSKTFSGPGGGGDLYGQIYRVEQGYQPTAGQVHIYNTSTIALTGGAMDWRPGTGGTMGTGWENAAFDNGNNIAYFAFVDTFSRTKDLTGTNGVFWGGHIMQSSGGKPVDVGVVTRGYFRFALDASLATLEDSTANTNPIAIGAVTAVLDTVRGVQLNDTLTFHDVVGTPVEVKTVTAINYATRTVTVSVAFAAAYGAGQIVKMTHGGAAVNLALGQTAIIFNSTASSLGRSGDPNLVYGPQYGNTTGDIALLTGTDGGGEYVHLGFQRDTPNNGRIRLRQGGFSTNVNFATAGGIIAGTDIVCGAAGKLGFGSGSGFFFFVSAGHIFVTIDGGATSGMIR